jgi:hypothetical protein
MRALIFAGALGGALATAVAAEPVGRVSAIHVAIGPKLQARARLLGADQIAFLQNALEDDVQGAFEDAGMTGPGGARVALTIVDAQVDRPKDAGDRPDPAGLGSRRGGATIAGAITYPDGRVSSVSFRWYESRVRDPGAGAPWSDAQTAFEALARALARRQAPRGG